MKRLIIFALFSLNSSVIYSAQSSNSKTSYSIKPGPHKIQRPAWLKDIPKSHSGEQNIQTFIHYLKRALHSSDEQKIMVSGIEVSGPGTQALLFVAQHLNVAVASHPKHGITSQVTVPITTLGEENPIKFTREDIV